MPDLAIPRTKLGRRFRIQITPALFIRLHVLNLTAQQVAYALGVSSRAVSYYETNGSIPEYHREKYEALAAKRGRKIPAKWFTEVPLPPNVIA